MLKLKMPEVPEKLEFGNDKHYRIIKIREILGHLRKSQEYIKWRSEYKFYEYLMYNLLDEYAVNHLRSKFQDKLYELEYLIKEKEDKVGEELEIKINELKYGS